MTEQKTEEIKKAIEEVEKVFDKVKGYTADKILDKISEASSDYDEEYQDSLNKLKKIIYECKSDEERLKMLGSDPRAVFLVTVDLKRRLTTAVQEGNFL